MDLAGSTRAAVLVAVVNERWAIVFLVGIWTLMAVLGVLAVLMPPRNRAACDRIFAEFTTTGDEVVVNRNGWLLYKMNCGIGRRYRALQQAPQ